MHMHDTLILPIFRRKSGIFIKCPEFTPKFSFFFIWDSLLVSESINLKKYALKKGYVKVSLVYEIIHTC